MTNDPALNVRADRIRVCHVLLHSCFNNPSPAVALSVRASTEGLVVLDVAFQAGANTVESVTFTLKDPEAAQNAALRSASAKARARATAMAEGQGLRVGDVIAVSECAHDGGPIEGGFPKAAMLRSASVEPGSIEVTATVTVVYALKAR